MKPAPILLFVYNRPWHTAQTVNALRNNILASESDLIIYSDGAKNSHVVSKVQETREFIKTIKGFKSVRIVQQEINLGLAESVIKGVSETLKIHKSVIVLEDDLVTSQGFLKFMNDGLAKYETKEEVISIHGYCYNCIDKLPPTFFLKGADCWGWATWRRGWDLFQPNGSVLLSEIKKRKLSREFNFENSFDYFGMLKKQIAGKNDSWAIRWYASAFIKNKLTLYPGNSLVQNIGNDNSGTHSKKTNFYSVNLSNDLISLPDIQIVENIEAKIIIIDYFKRNKFNLSPKELISKIRNIFN